MKSRPVCLASAPRPVPAWAGVAILILLTWAAYGPVLRAGFVWDDDSHVTANPTLRDAEGLARIWLDPWATPQYYPLVHTTFWVEYHLWGTDPVGYHVVNVLLHAANALLLWRLLRRLDVPAAGWAAALFALHPVQAESVAWVSERKNVLSTLCYLGSFLALLRFCPPEEARPAGRWRVYLVAVGLFLAALFGKTVVCTLPAAFLLVRWWKQGRLSRRDFAVAAPLLALGLALGLVTVALEKDHVGARGPDWDWSAGERVLIAGRAVWFYLGKLAWPAGLTFIYPRWDVRSATGWQYACPLALLAVPGVLFLLRRRLGRGPLTAVLFFVGTLVPALGFFDVYPMRFSFVADHFQYLACAGPLALVAATAAALARRWAVPARASALTAAGAVAVLAVLTWQRAEVYRDGVALWTDTLARNPGCWLGWFNRGVLLEQAGQAEQALGDYTRALELRGDLVEARTNRGNLNLKMGRPEQAAEDYTRAIAARPEAAEPYLDRGVALYRLGRVEEAAADCTRALERQPGLAQAWANRGLFRYQLGLFELAVADYSRALALDGDRADLHHNRAVAYEQLGRDVEALADYAAAARLAPDFAPAHLNAAGVYCRLKRYPEAWASLRRGRELGGTPAPELVRALSAAGRPLWAGAHGTSFAP